MERQLAVRGDAARVAFATGVIPRLAALQGAFQDQQVEVEVRRTDPLALVLRRRGARPIVATLQAALDVLAADRARAAA